MEDINFFPLTEKKKKKSHKPAVSSITHSWLTIKFYCKSVSLGRVCLKAKNCAEKTMQILSLKDKAPKMRSRMYRSETSTDVNRKWEEGRILITSRTVCIFLKKHVGFRLLS